MDENKQNKNDTGVHIEQVNPREELNDLEKTAILQFKIDQEEKVDLSKTQQFRLLNQKKKDTSLGLPKSNKVVDEVEIENTPEVNFELDMPKE